MYLYRTFHATDALNFRPHIHQWLSRNKLSQIQEVRDEYGQALRLTDAWQLIFLFNSDLDRTTTRIRTHDDWITHRRWTFPFCHKSLFLHYNEGQCQAFTIFVSYCSATKCMACASTSVERKVIQSQCDKIVLLWCITFLQITKPTSLCLMWELNAYTSDHNANP